MAARAQLTDRWVGRLAEYTAMSRLPEATFVPSEEELDYIEYLYPALLTYDRRKAQDAADQWTRLSKSVADALSNRLSGAKFAVVGSRHP